MLVEEIQEIGNSFAGVTESIKWGNHLTLCVGEKMFIIIGLDCTPPTASFKVHAEEFDTIIERQGFSPAPYLAKNKWVHVSNISFLGKKEWEKYLIESYNLVKQKLTKKALQQIEKS